MQTLTLTSRHWMAFTNCCLLLDFQILSHYTSTLIIRETALDGIWHGLVSLRNSEMYIQIPVPQTCALHSNCRIDAVVNIFFGASENSTQTASPSFPSTNFIETEQYFKCQFLLNTNWKENSVYFHLHSISCALNTQGTKTKIWDNYVIELIYISEFKL